MSTLLRAFAVAAMLSVPAISFAQSNTTVTRSQVKAELVQWEAAGYNPGRVDNANYPADVQAAESKLAMKTAQAGTPGSVGGVPTDGSFAAGAAVHKTISLSCVGPASFCSPYFGS